MDFSGYDSDYDDVKFEVSFVEEAEQDQLDSVPVFLQYDLGHEPALNPDRASVEALQGGHTVTFFNAVSGESWNVKLADGAKGIDSRKALSKVSGIPAHQIKIFGQCTFEPVLDSDDVTADTKELFMTRIPDRHVLVTCQPKQAGHHNCKASIQRWVPEPQNVKWHALECEFKRECSIFYGCIRFEMPGVTLERGAAAQAADEAIARARHGTCFSEVPSIADAIALRRCSVASLLGGHITDDVIQKDVEHFEALEAAKTEESMQKLLVSRAEAVLAGKRPCSCCWCACDDFSSAGDGQVCTSCSHSILEHSGEQFAVNGSRRHETISAALEKSQEDLLSRRLKALEVGKRPCGHGLCECSDFIGTGRFCEFCSHGIFEHSGKKFEEVTGMAAVGKMIVQAAFSRGS
eukprot:TRINITY_DN33859_c0_g1_i1.p1 TRINITY_DN33859_c0_g1~~TRINITY_DN33859_c0_g1_i1.p1  ORF type:complete len:406 (+),score=65.81 TRINITY_DN33859_c0_g1_i1:26-1243(+)